MKSSISAFFVHLLSRKNFYGQLAASLQRVAKPGLGTMAVGVYKGRVTLYYDPAFIEAISMTAAMFVLEHEMLHLVLDHIPRYLELLSHCVDDKERLKAQHVYNIAMDCAINSLLRDSKHFKDAEEFTKDWCLAHMDEDIAAAAADRAERIAAGEAVEDVPPLTEADRAKARERAGMCLPEKYDMEDKRSFEVYQAILMSKVKMVDLSGLGLGSFHGLWMESDEEGDKDGKASGGGSKSGSGSNDPKTSDMLSADGHRLREQIKRLLRSTLKAYPNRGRGLLPGGVEEFLSEYLADPIVPWWEVFATRAKTSKTSKFRRSVIVPNRSLLALSEEDESIIPFPGRVRDKTWRIFFMRDTSGSMSTESLEIAVNELNHMLRVDEGMEVRYMDGDAAVHRDLLLKPGDEIPLTAVGRGGTDFAAYFDYMSQYVHDDSTRPDLVIVYTDGYAPAVPMDSRLPLDIPVIWLVTPNYSKDTLEGYGEIIVADPSHNNLYSS